MYDIFVKQMYTNPKYENKWPRDLNLNPQFNWQKANNYNILKHTKDTQIIWFQILSGRGHKRIENHLTKSRWT